MTRPTFQAAAPFAAAFLSLTVPATAQEGEPAEAAPPLAEAFRPADRWTIQIEPSAWYVSPGGRVTLPGSGSTGEGDRVQLNRLNIDTPRLSPAGEIHLQADRARLTLGGFAYSIERESTAAGTERIGGIALARGDDLTTELDFITFEATGAYELISSSRRGQVSRLADGRVRFEGTLDAVAGVRFYGVDFDLASAAGSDGAHETFAQPIVGAKLEMAFIEEFTIDVQLTAGGLSAGDRSSWSWDITIGMMWRPVENVGVQVGYRSNTFNLETDAADAPFEYKGSLAGLYAGVVVRF